MSFLPDDVNPEGSALTRSIAKTMNEFRGKAEFSADKVFPVIGRPRAELMLKLSLGYLGGWTPQPNETVEILGRDLMLPDGGVIDIGYPHTGTWLITEVSIEYVQGPEPGNVQLKIREVHKAPQKYFDYSVQSLGFELKTVSSRALRDIFKKDQTAMEVSGEMELLYTNPEAHAKLKARLKENTPEQFAQYYMQSPWESGFMTKDGMVTKRGWDLAEANPLEDFRRGVREIEKRSAFMNAYGVRPDKLALPHSTYNELVTAGLIDFTPADRYLLVHTIHDEIEAYPNEPNSDMLEPYVHSAFQILERGNCYACDQRDTHAPNCPTRIAKELMSMNIVPYDKRPENCHNGVYRGTPELARVDESLHRNIPLNELIGSKSFVPNDLQPKRSGGVVDPNRTWLGDDSGPELFVPSKSGRIIPNV